MSREGIALKCLEVRYQSGPQRVQMDVSNEFEEVGLILADDRFEAPLKEMTGPAVSAVEAPPVTGQQRPHQVAERPSAGAYQKMGMVGDQRPSVNQEPTVFRQLFEAGNEIRVVAVVSKDERAVDTTRHYVV